MDYKIVKLKRIKDSRGALIVFLRESDLDVAQKKFGQIYFVTFDKKGVIRGNHYHKRWHEWFGIVEGSVRIIIENVRTKNENQ